jgi:PAS domain-containing protein
MTTVGTGGHGIRQGDERFALALEAGRMGTWEWDIVSGILHWDLPLMHVFGTSPEQFDGTFDGFLALVHPADRGTVVAEVQRALAQRSASEVEHRVQLPDGRVRWINGTGWWGLPRT